uniref:RNA polymerase I-specific transcription initiation factor RRN3 n=2 Tax=Cannabis sativa TaxID=3483 RepID=A0A803QFY0_CANSA
MNMWSCRIDVMDALIELIISLAASSGKYVDSCLEMLVGNFTPPSSMIEFLKQPRGISIKYQVLSRVHSSLEVLADLVPISPMRLLPIVIQRKPHYTSKEASLVVYAENMLKLESCIFGELVRSTMISGLIDLLVDLDVEIGWDDILHDDSTKGIFNMELEDIDEASDDELMDSSELPRELSRKGLVGNLFAEKLDNLMVVVFEHLNSCEEGGRLNEVFGNLLQSFQKTVLTAYKSKFSQFIMFYACALDPENCGSRFTKMLLDIFVCNTHPPILRMSAVAYLASYLSRGKFLSTSSIAKTLKSLVQWCLDYCNSHEGEINPKAHRIFYSGCQAIMYVLCFRMRSLVGVPWFKSQLLVPINLILSHNLSPLKVCLPSIVTEFLRQSKAADLFTSSEKFNFDEYLESESEFSKAFGGMERLDMFFPFDPCLLKRSDSFIRPNYVYWSMVRPTYNDEEEDSSDEEVEVNTEIEGNHEDFDIDEFDNALNQMSITPKNRFAGGFNEHLRMPSRIRPSTSPESL